jgi:anti-anti-sigma regulatory factor
VVFSVYATQTLVAPAPVALRLIGILDAELVASFDVLQRGLAGLDGRTLLVDVRDVQVVGDDEVSRLVEVIRSARAQGRDVRLDARSLPWRTLMKKNLSTQPPISAAIRSDVRRTVIVAHSGKHKRR